MSLSSPKVRWYTLADSTPVPSKLERLKDYRFTNTVALFDLIDPHWHIVPTYIQAMFQ